MLTWQEYTQLARRTANRGPEDTDARRMDNFALGICGEVGELTSLLEQMDPSRLAIRQRGSALSDPTDLALQAEIVDETGDVLWYIAMFADTFNITLGDLMAMALQQCAPKPRSADPKRMTTERFEKTIARCAESEEYALGWEAEERRMVQGSAEVANLVKKAIHHGHEPNLPKMVENLAKSLFFLTALLNGVGHATLGEAMEHNIEKLRRRYPQGFSEEASINRVV